MAAERVNVFLLVQGAEVRVRFHDEAEYEKFIRKVNGGVILAPQLVYSRTGIKLWIRPSEVGLYSRDGERR